MGIIIWIIFGGLAGWVASLLMKSNGSVLSDIIVGIIGAIIGGFLMSLIGQSGVTTFNLYSFLVAVLGACVLIAIMRAVRR